MAVGQPRPQLRQPGIGRRGHGGRAVAHGSADENPDLLWALRGGGGNFGVVTSLEYQLHPIGPEVLAGWLIFPIDSVREFFARVNDFTDSMPDEMT